MSIRLLEIKTPKFPCVTITQEELKTNKIRVLSYFEEHPDTILLIEAAPESTLSITREDIPLTVKHLKIMGNHVTEIGTYFLSGCSGLITIDLSPLSKVTTIGNWFLSGCPNLDRKSKEQIEQFQEGKRRKI